MIIQSAWLDKLRSVKRNLAYYGYDIWRLAAKRHQLDEIINQTEIRFIGLRRSGNHAVLSWIFQQLPKQVYFLNNVAAGMSPFRCYHLHFPQKGYRNEAWGNFSEKQYLVYSYEDYSLREICSLNSERKHDLWVGKTLKQFDVLILRDPFNLIASRLKKNYLKVKTAGESPVSLWIDHAKEFMCETNFLSHNKVVINYNQWCKSVDYRQKISRQLELTFSDEGLSYVSSYGGGSSFDGRILQGSAKSMDIEKRWQHFKDNDTFRALISDEKLLQYSNLIFGAIPGIAQLLSTL